MRRRKKLHNRIETLSLKKKMRMVYITILVVNMLFFMIACGFFYRVEVVNYAVKSEEQLLSSMEGMLLTKTENVNNMSKLMLADQSIRNYLSADPSDTRYLDWLVLNNLYNYIHLLDDFSSIHIIRPDGQHVSCNRDRTRVLESVLTEKSWQSFMSDQNGSAVIRVNGNGGFELYSDKPMVSYMRAVYDMETQKLIGYMVLNLKIDMIRDTYLDLMGNDSFAIAIADSGNRIFWQESSENGTEFHQDGDFKPAEKTEISGRYVLSAKKLHNWNFWVYMKKPVIFYKEQFMAMGIIILFFMIFHLITWFVVARFISNKITTPIEKLVSSMKKVKTGYLHRVSMKTSHDEIGVLKDSYNNMLVETNTLIERLVDEEKKKQQLELNVIQEQIKPHFLYNTLYTIEYMALKNGDREVYESLQILSDFYRNFLSKGRKEILLKEEFQIAKDYLKLQALRFGDIFEEEYHLESCVENCLVPRLILQPLVENSLYHGIRPKGEKGKITISARVKEKIIEVSIYDSGVGMDQEQMESIMKKDNSRSFGFKSTIERIMYYYGTGDVYELRSEEGEFTEVILKLPLRERV